MRIAVFYNNPYGGSGRIVYEYTRRLQERHEVRTFTLSPPGEGLAELETLQPNRPVAFTGFSSPPSPFDRLYPLFMLAGLRTLKANYRRVAEEINGWADVALVFPCIVTPAPLLLRFLQIPSVLLMGEPLRGYIEPPIERPYYASGRRLGSVSLFLDRYDPLQKLIKTIFWRLDVGNARSARKVLAYSYYSREMLYRAYAVNAQVNYAGVDANIFNPPVDEKRDNVVLSIGRVAPEKGHDFVIKSLALLQPSIRPRLVIAGDGGDGKEKKYLAQLAAERNVDVTFESSPHQDDIITRYQRAKLVAFAPILEPFGFVPLEAMACGTPVVGVREGGVRETIADEKGGFLVDREPADMADKIALLLSDKKLWHEQSQAGRKYVQSVWRWDKSIEKLQTYLLQVLNHDSRPPRQPPFTA